MKIKVKKWLCLFITIVLIFSSFSVIVNAENSICFSCNSAFDENGFCKDEECDEYEPATLNSNGYYEINNAGQLYWFSKEVNNGNVNINAILTDNIDVNPDYVFNEDGTVTYNGNTVNEGWLSWISIGNSIYKYNGVFDGNNKTVSGLYFNGEITDHYGMFGVIDSNSKIKNLGLLNSYIYSANSKKYYTGGIVGLNYGEVNNCYNSSIITGAHYTGGVAGCNQTEGIVFDCYNTGAISASTINYAKYAGGVVAYNYGIVEKCHNIGRVYAYSGYCAGVVGYNDDGKVSFCYNEGTATATNNGKNAGVVGYNYCGKVYQCFNTGTITMSAASGTAGIVGINEAGLVSHCYNTGEINGYDTTGGVVGANDEGSMLKICYNVGNIKGAHTITGGIAGSNKLASVISDCYNWGNIYSSIKSTGGISATNQGYYKYTDTPAAQIINCYNIGSVSNGDNKEYGQIFNNTGSVIGDAINCYYISDTESKTKEQFNSGEVLNLLNGSVISTESIWQQEIGVDPYPVFNKNILFYDGTNYYDIKTILLPMSSQIRFNRNNDGSYANMFDVRTRAMITDEDFKIYIADTNDEAKLKISKVGFVYSRNATTFSTEDAKKVAQGETVSGYTDAPVNYIQDADGYYMFTCIVTGIPIENVGESVTAYAYICVNDEWYFFDAEVTADFNQLYSKNYPLAAEAYGWEM